LCDPELAGLKNMLEDMTSRMRTGLKDNHKKVHAQAGKAAAIAQTAATNRKSENQY